MVHQIKLQDEWETSEFFKDITIESKSTFAAITNIMDTEFNYFLCIL